MGHVRSNDAQCAEDLICLKLRQTQSNLTKNFGLKKSITWTQEMVNKMTEKSNRDNRSRQKNPNNDQYYKDRGYQGGKSEYKKKYGM